MLSPLPRDAGQARRPSEIDRFDPSHATVPSRYRRPRPNARPWYVAFRATRWTWEGLRLALRLGAARVLGRLDARTVGRELKGCFERMGGTAIKAGQQLAIRVDLLPYEVCEELGLLLDRVAPCPLDAAIERVEAAAGPLDEVFEAFDPNPIGSASVAVVYQARLKSGERVAVKVRRPGVVSAFAADLRCFDLVTSLAERLTLVRPGLFRHLRTELSAMLLEELDFEAEARYQRLFRKAVEDQRIDWITAPEVHGGLSSEDVLVSGFAEGVSCVELLAATETGRADVLAALAAQGIDPVEVARRIAWLSYWGRFEVPFFHADPHPGNLVILPGNRLVLLDFGSCAPTTADARDNALEMCRRAIADDPSGLTGVAVAQSSPFPPIDLSRFRAQAESVFHRMVLNTRDPHSGWWEKTSAGMWLAFVEAASEHQIPVALDTLRMIRSTLLYDTLALRLNPKADYALFDEYMRGALTRKARRGRKWLGAPGWFDGLASAGALTGRLQDGLGDAVSAVRIPSPAALGLGALTALYLLRFGAVAAGGVLLVAWIEGARGLGAGLTMNALATASHPFVVLLLAAAAVLTLRRLLFRLDDVKRL